MVDEKDAKKLAQLHLRLSEYTSRYWTFFEDGEESWEESLLLAAKVLQECSTSIRSLLANLDQALSDELSGILGDGWRIKLSMMLDSSLSPITNAVLSAACEGIPQSQIDFSKTERVENWEEIEMFLEQTEKTLFGAYLLFKTDKCDYFEDATGGVIPPLNIDSGEWIESPDLAERLGRLNPTLVSNRSKGVKLGDAEGIDERKRPWRRSPQNKVWYYIPGLNEEERAKVEKWLKK